MRRPTIAGLPPELAQAARFVAETLRTHGVRAWIVGGAVRDLLLGVEPRDVDLASAATPEEIEALFSTSHAVGKAFGTVVVRAGELDVQITTFRSESGYDDARHPEHVSFAATPQEDARRRDFTCNALYLDPLDNELLDPGGGLADLEAGRLRCMGEPHERFGEDGLRILRLARLSARFQLEVQEDTRAGARASLAALRGVSPERVLAELERMASGPRPQEALALLQQLGALERLPGFELHASELGPRVAALEHLPDCDGTRLLALLLLPGPAPADAARKALLALRPSRALRRRVEQTWRVLGALRALLANVPRQLERRSLWVPLVREEAFEDAMAVDEALEPERKGNPRALLRQQAAALSAAELRPPALLSGEDLERAGIPSGPRRATLLRTAEAMQLDGQLLDAGSARAWLEREARAKPG